MVNKDVLFQTFMKLESYDKINIISNILKFSNSIELEFYSSIIESLLHYQKLSFETLKEELNHDDNILFLKNTECIDSNIRSKLISTLSLLKVSNITGAGHIFEFLRKNYYKFKELAQSNPNTYEEILLIYQLANDHPAFSFNHCQEIYDYLKEIKAVPLVIKDYSEIDINDEIINDLNVASIEKNDQQQYIYRIKVKWNRSECCITRTLEDVYKFYSRLYEMFTVESKNGQICSLYLSYIPDNLDLSKTLMTKFFKDFLNSPRHVLHCDYVRQFFKPRITDKHICDCDSCRNNNKSRWSSDQTFDNISNCSSPNNPSDSEEYTQSYDNKTGILSYAHFNFSSTSKCLDGPIDVSIRNQSSSDDGSESSLKTSRNNNRTFHSSGSSPINTPSDESEICTKNEISKHHSSEICRQLNKGIKKNDMMPLTKDRRTENWLCQSSNPATDQSRKLLQIQTYSSKSELESLEHYNECQESVYDSPSDMSQYYHCQIGNMFDWLKQTRLHKYHSFIKHMNFGEFHILTEDTLNNLGFVDGASKKLISLISKLTRDDISVVADNMINLAVSRNRSNSNDSSRSVYGSCGDISLQKSDFYEFNGNKVMEQSSPTIFGMLPQFLCQPYMSMPNLIMLSPNIIPGSHIFSAASKKQLANQSSVHY